MPPRGKGFPVKTCQHSIYTRLEVRRYRSRVNRATLLCTNSIFLIEPTVYGSHTFGLYSKTGRTQDWYASPFTLGLPIYSILYTVLKRPMLYTRVVILNSDGKGDGFSLKYSVVGDTYEIKTCRDNLSAKLQSSYEEKITILLSNPFYRIYRRPPVPTH